MPCSIRGSGAWNRPSRLKKNLLSCLLWFEPHDRLRSAARVLSRDSPTWCSAQSACHGCRLRAKPGVPGARIVRAGVEVGRPVPRHPQATLQLDCSIRTPVPTSRAVRPFIEPERRRWVTADGAPHLARSPSPVRVFFGRAPGGAVRGHPPPEWRRSGGSKRRIYPRRRPDDQAFTIDSGATGRPRTAQAGAPRSEPTRAGMF